MYRIGLIVNGVVTEKNGKYYVSVVCDVEKVYKEMNTNEPIDIDLGIKDFAISSNGTKFKNINKASQIKNLKRNLKENNVDCRENMK